MNPKVFSGTNRGEKKNSTFHRLPPSLWKKKWGCGSSIAPKHTGSSCESAKRRTHYIGAVLQGPTGTLVLRTQWLETVMSLILASAQNKAEVNLVAAKGRKKLGELSIPSLFYGHYCTYADTSLSSFLVLHNTSIQNSDTR